MNAKVFLGTKILIYAHDANERHAKKRDIARETISELLKSRNVVLSPQVLQEFYVNVTRKVAKPLTRPVARAIVQDLSPLCVEMSITDIVSAFRIEDAARISFWDALICASALRSGAGTIFSEDMNHGQDIAGVRITNPFRTPRD